MSRYDETVAMEREFLLDESDEHALVMRARALGLETTGLLPHAVAERMDKLFTCLRKRGQQRHDFFEIPLVYLLKTYCKKCKVDLAKVVKLPQGQLLCLKCAGKQLSKCDAATGPDFTSLHVIGLGFADAAVLPMKKESLDVSFDPGSSEKKSYVLIKSKIEGSNIGWEIEDFPMFLRKVTDSSPRTLKDFLYRCGEEKFETCKEKKLLEEACVEMFLADMEMFSTIEHIFNANPSELIGCQACIKRPARRVFLTCVHLACLTCNCGVGANGTRLCPVCKEEVVKIWPLVEAK